jgi:hypothetical protein
MKSDWRIRNVFKIHCHEFSIQALYDLCLAHFLSPRRQAAASERNSIANEGKAVKRALKKALSKIKCCVLFQHSLTKRTPNYF